jgi:hypothetical protein
MKELPEPQLNALTFYEKVLYYIFHNKNKEAEELLLQQGESLRKKEEDIREKEPTSPTSPTSPISPTSYSYKEDRQKYLLKSQIEELNRFRERLSKLLSGELQILQAELLIMAIDIFRKKKSNELSLIENMLENRLDPNICNSGGRLAIVEAVLLKPEEKAMQLVKALLKYHANIFLEGRAEDKDTTVNAINALKLIHVLNSPQNTPRYNKEVLDFLTKTQFLKGKIKEQIDELLSQEALEAVEKLPSGCQDNIIRYKKMVEKLKKYVEKYHIAPEDRESLQHFGESLLNIKKRLLYEQHFYTGNKRPYSNRKELYENIDALGKLLDGSEPYKFTAEEITHAARKAGIPRTDLVY